MSELTRKVAAIAQRERLHPTPLIQRLPRGSCTPDLLSRLCTNVNGALMRCLAGQLSAPVEAVEAVGWDGDALEAQAFAYLAVRSLAGMPLSFPLTTGVAAPLTGGRLTIAT